MRPPCIGLLFAGLMWAYLGMWMPAFAQTYPSKPIRLVVPYPAGGGTDLAARVIAQKLHDDFGHQVVVDNRPGADGNIGTNAIAKAPADGYTIGMTTPGPVTVGPSFNPKLPYDPAKELTPIINVNQSPIVLALNPSISAKSIAELVSLVKAKPGKLTAALPGSGSVPHLLTEMLKITAGLDIISVPYKGGGPAAMDVLGGQVDMLFSVLVVVLPFLNSGKLKPLAVTTDNRNALIPNVPTTREAGFPMVNGSTWNGVVAPSGVPQKVVLKLNSEINKVLGAPDVKERFSTFGMEAIGGTPDGFSNFLRAESTKWARVVKAANIRAE